MLGKMISKERQRITPSESYGREYFLHLANPLPPYEKVVEMLGVRQGEHILDVRCGVGNMSHPCIKKGAKYVGIDYSKDAAKIARSTASEEIIRATATLLPFKNVFDKVILIDVLEHPDEEDSIKALKEFLKRDLEKVKIIKELHVDVKVRKVENDAKKSGI
jgi:2-polyprenyl-3-methyl-5-hydroxy-6-metoxy-1,4-benzoquinol methylase